MEDFDDKPLNPLTPDEEPEERAAEGGSKLLVVALLLALGGLATGVAGIVMANQSAQKVEALREQLANAGDPTADLQQRVQDMDDRIVTLGSEIVKLGRTDRQLRDNVQAAIDSISREVQQQRGTLSELAGNMDKLNSGVSEMRQGGGSSRSSSSSASTSSSSSTERTSPPSSDASTASTSSSEGGVRTYTVESGDNYYRIARKTGTTVDGITAANPGVNPNRLHVGQELNLPVE
ncbi:MAG: peptidoglycan-binding lysin domain-containing protein [Puniceicoccaceae bacterium 5H]|nr:MAG: peptidoglycan-binding lysin domain-containing protein [Puniceicoccaceae bacterium 5H]